MENNNNQTKSTGKTVLIVFLLLVTIVAVILATYAWAKYTETFNGEATAQVAKWNVTATPGTTIYSQTFDHVVSQRVAPGTSGSLTSSLNINDTEVDVDYTVTLLDVVPVGEGVIPANLIIKAADGDIIYQNKAKVGDAVIATGRIEEESDTTSVSETFSWEWPYETPEGNGKTVAQNNEQDTADGKKAGSFKITYKIDAVQVQPTPAP